MTHAAAGWRGASGDESDHRLLAPSLRFVRQELRRIFFSRTADLADHHDRFSFLVGQKHLQHRDELGALDRIAADADRSGLAEILTAGLENRLIGERTGARN